VLAVGYPVTTALTVSASLAQIGEFSFILAGLGVAIVSPVALKCGATPTRLQASVRRRIAIEYDCLPFPFVRNPSQRVWRYRSATAGRRYTHACKRDRYLLCSVTIVPASSA
jgi:hypothetical protein